MDQMAPVYTPARRYAGGSMRCRPEVHNHPGQDHLSWMFLVCVLCRSEKRLSLPHYLTDAEAEVHFNELGWAVKLTACPDCITWLL